MAWPPTTHQDVQDEIDLLKPAHVRPGYYAMGTQSTASVASSTLSGGFVYTRPFHLYQRASFDRIGVNVATAATAASGGAIACGIYQPGPGVPGSLHTSNAPVSSETAGVKEWTISVTLDPGIWWLATLCVTAGCQVTAFATSGFSPAVSAGTTPPSTGVGWLGYVMTGSATVLPTTFAPSTGGAAHAVGLRAA